MYLSIQCHECYLKCNKMLDDEYVKRSSYNSRKRIEQRFIFHAIENETCFLEFFPLNMKFLSSLNNYTVR